MRWPASGFPQPRPSETSSRRGIGGTRRLALIAGVSAVLLVFVAGAASAGIFTGRGQVAAASAGRQKPQISALPRVVRHAVAWHRVRDGNAARPADRTSCTSVAHIGDSTSVGMVSPEALSDPAQRIAAQYRDVGVRQVRIDASGGRSIVEQLPGQLNGYRLASNWYQAGFRGCWVFALGTNDTANVFVGSTVGIAARIQEMMSAAHGEPVMWVNSHTDLSSGPWSQANMQLWNDALVAACTSYPNMRIFDWAAMVQPGWHLGDGIHYTPAGYAIRASAIAHALASAFPANSGNSSCIVG